MKTAILAVVLLLLGGFPVSGTGGADCYDYGTYFRWVGGAETPGYTGALAAAGSYTYFVDDTGNGSHIYNLRIADVSDPASPLIVGELELPGTAINLAVDDTCAYVAGGDLGLYVVDVANHADPQLVRVLDTAGFALDPKIAGHHVYVADGDSGVAVLDISDPLDPVPVATVPTPSTATAVAVSGSCACVGTSAGWLYVVDVSAPEVPHIVGAVSCGSSVVALEIMGEHAFLLRTSGLQVVDIADPTHPVLVGGVGFPRPYAKALVASHDRVYATDYDAGILVIDVSDPPVPVIIGRDGTGPPSGVALVDDHVYTGVGKKLMVFDVTSTEFPQVIGEVAIPEGTKDAAISGEYAFVGTYSHGLVVVDISDLHHPEVVASMVTPDTPYGVAISGSYAYLAVRTGGLKVVDISDPTSPFIVGGADIFWAIRVAVSGNFAYVSAGYSNTVQVVDLTNPLMPQVLGSVGLPSQPFGIVVAGTYAYVADSDAGLFVIDVSNPCAPYVVGGVATPWWAEDVAVAGNYAYLADSIALQVVDVSNPSSPHIVATAGEGGARHVVLMDHYAYVGGLQVIDIATPEAPVFVGGGNMFDNEAVAVAGSTVFLAGSNTGFQIIPAQCELTGVDDQVSVNRPAAISLGSYPNPFNPRTTVSFTLATAGHATLAIYDAKGQMVAQLVDETLAPGAHTVDWDGRDVYGASMPSGTYFCRLTTSWGVETRKLSLLR